MIWPWLTCLLERSSPALSDPGALPCQASHGPRRRDAPEFTADRVVPRSYLSRVPSLQRTSSSVQLDIGTGSGFGLKSSL